MSATSETEKIVRLFRNADTIAIVGASPKPDRPSYQVMNYLQNAGYTVYPVNPGQAGKMILDCEVYGSLADIEEPIDIVDVFRRSDQVGPIVEEAIAAKASAVWLQLDISNAEAEEAARKAGLDVITNRCTKIEHARLIDRINRD